MERKQRIHLRGCFFHRNKCFMLLWIVIFHIAISFCVHPAEDLLISEDLLSIDSFHFDTDGSVFREKNQIVFKESTQTRVAYALINVAEYDYLQVNLDAVALKDEQCRIYVDIEGDNTNLDPAERFYDQFYADTDAGHVNIGGKLELGRNHSETGMIRIMNDAGAPVFVSNVQISGWKFYNLSNYSIVMLLIFSVILMYMVQKSILNDRSVWSCLAKAVIAFGAVNALFGGLADDVARSCNSMSAIIFKCYEFLVSDSQYSWLITISLLMYFYLLLQTRNITLHNYSVVSSYIFSLFILSGYMYDTANVFFELYHQKYFWLECLLLITGLALFMQSVMKILHIFMEYVAVHSNTLACSRKKCFLASWIMITVVWFPHLLVRYPAAIHWDSSQQINEVLQGSINTVQPIFSTLLMGGAAKFGNILFGSYSLGIFLYTLTQMILCSAIFAYGISLLTEFHVSRFYIWTAVFICSFMPIFSSFTTSVSKDVPFSNLVMLFLLMLFEILKLKSHISLRFNVVFAVITILVFLITNKGIFYVLVSIIGVSLFGIIKKDKKYWSLLAILILSFLSAKFVQVSVNTIYGSISHLNVTICQPLQEIGYYAMRYEDELSKEDKELIDRFVIYEKIADSYNMDFADGMFRDIWRVENEHSANEICQLALLWFRGFIKHPDCYVDATLRCNYGFYYPDTKQWGNYNSGYYMANPVPYIDLPFTYSALLEKINIKLSKLIMLIEDIPVLYFFNSVALSVWIQIFIFLYMFLQKKWEELFCVLVALVSFALCLIGPTYYCGGARYALVSVFFNVFLVGYWISDRYRGKPQDRKHSVVINKCKENDDEQDKRADSNYAVFE